MAIGVGPRLGPYEVLALLGEGGIGEVYRAADCRLGREVAIKVLPDSVHKDPERLARLHRERGCSPPWTIPNIATIHGLEESESGFGRVMELVPRTVTERATVSRPPAVDEALRVCGDAEALEAAIRGITHRDIRTADIEVTPHGVVKLLDFGLAKLAAGG